MKKHLIAVIALFLLFVTPACAFIDIDTIQVPDEYGKIAEKSQGTTEKAVFVISDIHNNFEAQKSISNTIEYIVNYYNTNLIGCEGARDSIQTQNVANYYNRGVRSAVSEYYMQQGFIGGAVHNAIVTSSDAVFQGLEKRDLYEKQFELYRSSYEQRQATLEQIDVLVEILYRFKQTMYPRELFELEESYSEYHKDVRSLIDYINVLLSLAIKYDISYGQHPNMLLLNDVRKIEGEIDYTRVDQEEQDLLVALKKIIGNDIGERTLLKETTKKYQEQTITESSYYEVLYSFLVKYKIDSADYINIWRTIQRSQILKKIDSVRIYDESTQLYPLLQKELLKSAASSKLDELLALSKALKTLRSVVTFDASYAEVDDYLAKKDQFSSPRFISFIRDNAMKHNVGYRINPKVVQIDKIDSLIKDYYDLSHERSNVIYDKLMQSISTQEIQHAVIVVGKFHTGDILKRLKADDITYVLINPYISRLHGTIDIVGKHLGTQPQVKGYISTYAQHLKPWETLSPKEPGSDLYFRYLLNVEYMAHDLAQRVSGLGDGYSDEAITKQIHLIKKEITAEKRYPIELVHVVRVALLDKIFIDLKVGEGERALRFLVEPLAQRATSYADATIGAIAPLNMEQLDRGVFRSSDRLLNILSQEYDAQIFSFKSDLLEAIERELAQEEKVRLTEEQRLIEKVEPQLLTTGPDDEQEAEAINTRLNRLKEIEAAIDETMTLESLNEYESEFILLKSQLSFYVMSQTNNAFVAYLEKKLDEKIDIAIKHLEKIEAKKREAAKMSLEKERAERKMQEAMERKKKRKVINDIIDTVSQLKEQVDSATSLVMLNEIEDTFNETIESLKYNDLIKEDRVILNAFKISWETKYSLLKQQVVSAPTDESGVPVDGATILGARSAVIQAYIQQAFNLKELVGFSSIPSDASFIADEFEKLKQQEHYAQLSVSEKELFDKIGEYIAGVLEDLRTGKKAQKRILLKTLNTAADVDVATFSASQATDDYFTEIYTLRNKIMQSKTLREVNEIYAHFHRIDTAMKERDLSERQKSILADTERMITDAVQHYQKKIAREKQKGQEKLLKQKEIEKQAFIRTILGEKAQPKVMKKVFFIENNFFERDIVSKRLQEEGYFVKEAETFGYDMPYFLASKYNVILLDDDIIQNTTGLDFVIRIKQADKYNTLPPIVIHTNNSKSWIFGILKRKGITRQSNVHIVSKRDLEANIDFIAQITS